MRGSLMLASMLHAAGETVVARWDFKRTRQPGRAGVVGACRALQSVGSARGRPRRTCLSLPQLYLSYAAYMHDVYVCVSTLGTFGWYGTSE